jgi:hypothetical protein
MAYVRCKLKEKEGYRESRGDVRRVSTVFETDKQDREIDSFLKSAVPIHLRN